MLLTRGFILPCDFMTFQNIDSQRRLISPGGHLVRWTRSDANRLFTTGSSAGNRTRATSMATTYSITRSALPHHSSITPASFPHHTAPPQHSSITPASHTPASLQHHRPIPFRTIAPHPEKRRGRDLPEGQGAEGRFVGGSLLGRGLLSARNVEGFLGLFTGADEASEDQTRPRHGVQSVHVQPRQIRDGGGAVGSL